MYVSHVFSKTLTLISSIVIHVYANFMGYPEYFEIFKGGQSADDRVRSKIVFNVRNNHFLSVWSCGLLMLLPLFMIILKYYLS